MIAEPIAVQMAAQSTHRHIHEAKRERAPRPRRATARVLQADRGPPRPRRPRAALAECPDEREDDCHAREHREPPDRWSTAPPGRPRSMSCGVREKAHTHEGDAIAAARRRLPMVEVDAAIPLTGPDGPVTLLETFEGRRQLIAYYHMWYTGQPAEAQCEGCTFYNGQVRELAYLHSRDVTYATFCQGPYEESVRYRDFMGWDVPWYSAQDSADSAARRAPRRHRSTWCATCATATGCSRPTGPAAAASRPWPRATGCWT